MLCLCFVFVFAIRYLGVGVGVCELAPPIGKSRVKIHESRNHVRLVLCQ